MISRRCWSSTHSQTHSRGSRRNFKRAAVQILLQELMISILTGSYDCLCVCAPQCSCFKVHFLSFIWIKTFFRQEGHTFYNSGVFSFSSDLSHCLRLEFLMHVFVFQNTMTNERKLSKHLCKVCYLIFTTYE